MITIYTELGAIFDERRMILSKMAREAGNHKFDWQQNFQRVYQERRYDVFDYPEFGFSPEKYQERFDQRTKEDFGTQVENFLFPTRLCRDMFAVVREYEFGVGKLLQVETFRVTVNYWPYDLNEYELEELHAAIKGTVHFNFDLELITKAPNDLTPHYLHGFRYIFKYDYLTSKKMERYWSLYGIAALSNARFVVPDVFSVKPTLPEGMEAETPKELIEKLNAVQGGKVTWIPCDKRIYDSYS